MLRKIKKDFFGTFHGIDPEFDSGMGYEGVTYESQRDNKSTKDLVIVVVD